MPRTEVTKKLWAYIKKNGLQDKKNKRMINADDKLKAVFGGKASVNMFAMTKLVSKHLKVASASSHGLDDQTRRRSPTVAFCFESAGSVRCRTTPAALAALLLVIGLSINPDAQDRMPPIPAEQMTDAQRKAVAEFRAARNAGCRGPFVPLLRSPEVMNRARAMGDYLRFNSVLPPRLSEFAILITARRWTQNYEWDAHITLALKGGSVPRSRRRWPKDAGRSGWPKTKRASTACAPSCTEPERQRRDIRARGREVRRAGRHRHRRHSGLLHVAGDGAEHGADAAAGRPDAGSRRSR